MNYNQVNFINFGELCNNLFQKGTTDFIFV